MKPPTTPTPPSQLPPAWSILPAEWRTLCPEMGLPPYRASQITNALYQNFITSWQEATTLPTELRNQLQQRCHLAPLQTITTSGAPDGVRKLLLQCQDSNLIETVLIPSKERITQCISTQVGCAFGCVFCASGAAGKLRNLDPSEIVAQVMAACHLLRQNTTPQSAPPRPGAKPTLPRPNNIVVMGMGEPFDNYDNTLRALRILNDQKGLNIGARHITISTCGVVPGINRLAHEGTQFELSISLHAPNDKLRTQLMPVNKRWNIAQLLEACHNYNLKTRRIITFEYTLVRNLNDQRQHALELIQLLSHLPCKINLIPLSPTGHYSGETPEHQRCLIFLDTLLKAGINTTLRKSRGKDVDAACGQLRLRTIA